MIISKITISLIQISIQSSIIQDHFLIPRHIVTAFIEFLILLLKHLM